MRPDMAKVIVERPRFGSSMPTKGKGYDRRRQRIAWEDQPKRERMKLRGGGSKSLNEHLGPLRRYLEGKIGQYWNKIFADVCRYLDRDSAVQDHVRDHLEDYVAVRVMQRGGELYHADGYRIGRPLYSLFYVCPCTGILKKNRNARHWFSERLEKLQVEIVDNRTALVRKDGVWYLIEFAETPEQVWRPEQRAWVPADCATYFDMLLKSKINGWHAMRVYGRRIYAVSTRRASKREVRQVVNSYPYTNLVR